MQLRKKLISNLEGPLSGLFYLLLLTSNSSRLLLMLIVAPGQLLKEKHKISLKNTH